MDHEALISGTEAPSRDRLRGARVLVDAFAQELLDRFGAARLAETAYPVYTSRSALARWLGWSRIEHAARLIGERPQGTALDVGPGLGTLLPFLSATHQHVTAVDLEPDITRFMLERSRLHNVAVTDQLPGRGTTFDTITLLDVLEHVPEMSALYQSLLDLTAPGGRWVISGPTENLPYRIARRVAGTDGEGHVRTIYDVLDGVPSVMRRRRTVRLPFGSPAPLFVVATFERS